MDMGKVIRSLIHTRVADVDDKVSGILVRVPFYNKIETVRNDYITLFEFDALGATISEIFVSFYLPLHATATFTPSWWKTRPGDLVTFTQEFEPALSAIVTPAANGYYAYRTGELAQGLQARFRLHQSDHAGLLDVDAWAVARMVV